MVLYMEVILLSCSVFFLLLSIYFTRQPQTLKEWQELQERGLKESRLPLLMAVLSAFTFVLGGVGPFFV